MTTSRYNARYGVKKTKPKNMRYEMWNGIEVVPLILWITLEHLRMHWGHLLKIQFDLIKLKHYNMLKTLVDGYLNT